MNREEILERLEEVEQERTDLLHQLNRIPEACKCDIWEWRDGIPNGICTEYEEDEMGLCRHCQHEQECHE